MPRPARHDKSGRRLHKPGVARAALIL